MSFVKITYNQGPDHFNKEAIVNLDKIKTIKKDYPDGLNPNIQYEIVFYSFGIWRVPFLTKEEADNYFDYVMEKLRAIEFKKEPWV